MKQHSKCGAIPSPASVAIANDAPRAGQTQTASNQSSAAATKAGNSPEARSQSHFRALFGHSLNPPSPARPWRPAVFFGRVRRTPRPVPGGEIPSSRGVALRTEPRQAESRPHGHPSLSRAREARPRRNDRPAACKRAQPETDADHNASDARASAASAVRDARGAAPVLGPARTPRFETARGASTIRRGGGFGPGAKPDWEAFDRTSRRRSPNLPPTSARPTRRAVSSSPRP